MKLSQAATIILASIVHIPSNALEPDKADSATVEAVEGLDSKQEYGALDYMRIDSNKLGRKIRQQKNRKRANLRGSSDSAGAEDTDNQSPDLVSESISVPVDNHAEDQNAMNPIMSMPDEDLLQGNGNEEESQNNMILADQMKSSGSIMGGFAEDQNAMNPIMSMPDEDLLQGDGNEEESQNNMILADQMKSAQDGDIMGGFAEDQNAMNPIMSMPDEDLLQGDTNEEGIKSENGPDKATIWD
jgi:hypothetical protein